MAEIQYYMKATNILLYQLHLRPTDLLLAFEGEGEVTLLTLGYKWFHHKLWM